MIAVENENQNLSQENERLHIGFWFRLLRWICPEDLYEEIEGDLLQRFHRDVRKSGMGAARRRMVWNIMSFFRPGIIFRNALLTSLGLYSGSTRLDFRRVNNLTGWIVFFTALTVYFLTAEETASYWDCGEFIAASYKLQVPHPPGAPLFLLLGRIFSFFALGDVKNVAYAINMMSVLASAFTVLFLFWSIVLVGRKLMGADAMRDDQVSLLMGSGAVGALAYAFSDSFWFSAVEAEVYAMSSFFTAFVVWAILKWERVENRGEANRWLLLIAYMVGLSIGVHLLNLLTLPALALIYYFKSYKVSVIGVIGTIIAGCGFVVFVSDFVILGLPTIAGKFEIFFVNTLGWFFGSGALIFSIIVIGILAYSLYFTQQRGYAIANTIVLGMTFILIGYSSYSLIVIRSSHDPLINENAPKDVMSFVRYLRREQYVSPPLVFGPYFTSSPVDYKLGGVVYVKGKNKYEISDRKVGYAYAPGEETILPRAWDSDHKADYERIMGLQEGQRPTFSQNLAYMFRHQIGTMYWRYFFWNFAGREGDEEGANWLKPTQWFKDVPVAVADNAGRNNYFMIPLILGMLGMAYQYFKDRKNFYVLALLFIMLGLAIVGYLNAPPTEPRERDYIYVGSYYAFAFWIGLAVIALADIAHRIYENRKVAVAAAFALCLVAPVLMVREGWDDHDRSDRFFSVDSATNTLDSCEQNGILFTGGDNDTFPLWYAQEAEGCRTDLRVMVLSYFNRDWYINQTSLKAYQSDPFPYTLPLRQYRQGGPNDYLPYVKTKIESMDAGEYLRLLARDYAPLRSGDNNVIPSKLLTIPVDKSSVLAKGIIPKDMENLVVDQLEIKLLKNNLYKGDLAFLDLLVTSDWSRPIYLNNNTLSQLNLDVSKYLVQEGNVFRILPVSNPRSDRDYLVNTDKSYDLMLNKFAYRGLDDSAVYYNDDYKIPVLIHRTNLNSLAQSLIDKGKMEEANNVLNFSLEKMPYEVVSYDPSTPDTVRLLFRAGQRQRAAEVAGIIGDQAYEMADYLISEGGSVSSGLRLNLFIIGALQRNLYENGEANLAKRFEERYELLMADLETSFSNGQLTN